MLEQDLQENQQLKASFNANIYGIDLSDEHAPLPEEQGHISCELLTEGSRVIPISSTFKIDNVLLSTLEPMLARWAPGVELTGKLQGAGNIGTSAGKSGMTVGGNVEAHQVSLMVPGWMGHDRLQLKSCQLAGVVHQRGDQWEIDDVRLTSDVLKLQCNGLVEADETIDWRAEGVTSHVVKLLTENNYQLTGEVELARLAAMLPETLHVRNGTEFRQGRVDLSLSSRQNVRKERRWQGRINTHDISAIHQGRLISWKDPIDLLFTATLTKTGYTLNELKCRSSFISASAEGRLEEASVHLECQLDRLMGDLGQFIDFQGMKLAGHVEANLKTTLANAQSSKIDANGFLRAREFRFQSPGLLPLREDEFTLQLAATGKQTEFQLRELTACRIRVKSQQDQFDAKLQSPIDLSKPILQGNCLVRLRGGISSWQARLQPWVSFSGVQGAGEIDILSTIGYSEAGWDFRQSSVDLTRLQIRGNGLNISEAAARLEGEAQWSSEHQAFKSKKLHWSSSALICDVRNFTMISSQTAWPILTGVAEFTGDVDPIMRWFRDRKARMHQRMFGKLQGKIELSDIDGLRTGRWDITVDRPLIATPRVGKARQIRAAGDPAVGWKTVWKDQQLQLQGLGEYHPANDLFSLTECSIITNGLQGKVAGELEQVFSDPHVDFAGEISYDMQQLSKMLRGYIGEGLQIQGSQKRPFLLKGKLWESMQVVATGDNSAVRQVNASRAVSSSAKSQPGEPVMWISTGLRGEAGIGWQKADVYGLPVGSGDLKARLVNRVIRFEPVKLSVSRGQLQFEPSLHLRTTEPVLRIKKGQIARRIQFTPEMTNQWLKYVTPMLGESANIDGEFSLDFSHAQAPLSQFTSGDIGGVLHVHSAKAEPGTLAKQLVNVVQQVQSLLKLKQGQNLKLKNKKLIVLPEQDVDFRMFKGKVHHQQLIMKIYDVDVRTHGSVGLEDQSLNMVAEIPIQEKWVKGNSLLAGMQGKTLRIPIRGTTESPQFDLRFFSDLAGDLTQGAAQKFLQDNLGNGLKSLFGRSNQQSNIKKKSPRRVRPKKK